LRRLGFSIFIYALVMAFIYAFGLAAVQPAAALSFTGLGDLPEGIFSGSFNSYARGVSSDGSVVVGHGSTALGIEAFIWDATNGMRNLRTVLVDAGLNLTGWTLQEAKGVSADGLTIVGYGTNPKGDTEAWVADLSPIPEPTTLCLIGFGLLGLLGVIIRQRKKMK